MPIYVYSCNKHGKQEEFSSSPREKRCSKCNRIMDRDYTAEHAGLPPFKSYWTEALAKGTVQVNSRDEEKQWERKTGFTRVS